MLETQSYTIMTIITRPEKLDALEETLLTLGINGMTATPVEGCGRQNAEISYKEDGIAKVMLIPKIQVEVLFSGISTDIVIEKVCDVLRTGIMGDGKIFIQNQTGHIMKVRTGETNQSALN